VPANNKCMRLELHATPIVGQLRASQAAL
jgi:hypothetical protein